MSNFDPDRKSMQKRTKHDKKLTFHNEHSFTMSNFDPDRKSVQNEPNTIKLTFNNVYNEHFCIISHFFQIKCCKV